MSDSSANSLDPRLIKIALVMLVGMFAPMLDMTVVNVAIKTITGDLHAALAQAQWITTAYILAMGIAVPVSAWIGNRWSGRMVWILSQMLFLAGSILSGLSWNIESLIAFRVIQAAGAGIMMPVMQTMMVRIVGVDKLGRVMAIVGIPVLIIPILGPMAGGFIINALPWRWIFLVNIPLGIAGIALAITCLPRDSASNKHQKLDAAGLALIVPAFLALLLGVSSVRRGGLGAASMLLIAAGFVFAALFVVYALRAQAKQKTDANFEPILNVFLFRHRNFSASVLVQFFASIITTGTLFILPLFFQDVYHAQAFTAGMMLAPQGLGMLITRGLAGRMTDKQGARIVAIIGLVIALAGTLPLALWNFSSLIPVCVMLLVRGAGLGMVNIPVMVSIYDGLSKAEVPHGTTAMRIFQQIGGAFGTALLAIVLQHGLSASLVNLDKAYETVFWVVIAITAAAIVPAFFLGKRK